MEDFRNTVDYMYHDDVESALMARSITELKDEHIETIGTKAFDGCNSLTLVNLPNATSIGDNAFYGCSELKSVEFQNAKSIGSSAFSDTASLELTSDSFPSVENVLTGAFNASGITSIELPKAITIGPRSFQFCEQLESAYFPSAETIDAFVFSNCRSLKTLDIHNVTFIGEQTFRGCKALTKVDLHGEVILDSQALYGTGLDTLILRSNSGICVLNDANAISSTPIASGTGYIYVPRAMMSEYKCPGIGLDDGRYALRKSGSVITLPSDVVMLHLISPTTSANINGGDFSVTVSGTTYSARKIGNMTATYELAICSNSYKELADEAINNLLPSARPTVVYANPGDAITISSSDTNRDVEQYTYCVSGYKHKEWEPYIDQFRAIEDYTFE